MVYLRHHIYRLRWRKIAHHVIGAGLLAWTSGCASVAVQKVPTPSQYIHWTDDMQRRADAIQGLRFYLPRPFVNVFESFPVRTDIYLADGVVSSDGKYVIIKRIRGDSNLAKLWSTENDVIAVPTTGIVEQLSGQSPSNNSLEGNGGNLAPGGTPLAPQSPTSTPNTIRTGITGTTPKSNLTPTPPSGTSPNTGLNQQAVTNDNGAFAYQPLRGNFDLVYLPDFEEQYAVDSRAGLGNANFQLNLGQGWSLQGFNSLTDNSEINKRVFNLIDTTMKLANDAASAALGDFLPVLSSAIQGNRLQGAGGNLSTMGERPPGTPVTLKIVIVHYAAKGLYPVIKPRELEERKKASSQTTYCVLDLFKVAPSVDYASDFDETAIQNAQKATDNESMSFTVPRYPYQYLSFNTFSYLAIEVVQPSDDPFKVLYDKTGTRGDPGDAQTGSITSLLNQLRSLYGGANNNGGGVSVPKDPTALVSQVNDPKQTAFPSDAPGKNQPYYALANAKYDPVHMTITADLISSPSGTQQTTGKQDAFAGLQTAIAAEAKAVSIPFTSLIINQDKSTGPGTLAAPPLVTTPPAAADPSGLVSQVNDPKQTAFPSDAPGKNQPYYALANAKYDPVHMTITADLISSPSGTQQTTGKQDAFAGLQTAIAAEAKAVSIPFTSLIINQDKSTGPGTLAAPPLVTTPPAAADPSGLVSQVNDPKQTAFPSDAPGKNQPYYALANAKYDPVHMTITADLISSPSGTQQTTGKQDAFAGLQTAIAAEAKAVSIPFTSLIINQDKSTGPGTLAVPPIR